MALTQDTGHDQSVSLGNSDPGPDARARFESDALPYLRQLFPAALRLTSDRRDAEDLLQETFARAYQKFHQFTPGSSLRAWLHIIMTRTFCSMCRRRGSRPAEVPSADLAGGAGGHPAQVPQVRSAEVEALEQIGDSAVMRALATLPKQFKTVLYLADVHGYRYGEIAHLTGAPVGTVASQIHRGRQMMRAKLGSADTAEQAASMRWQPARSRPASPDENGQRAA